jgi:hypothetical protein
MPDRLNARRLWIPVLTVVAVIGTVSAFRAESHPVRVPVLASLAH